jgi:hypothetical protein
MSGWGCIRTTLPSDSHTLIAAYCSTSIPLVVEPGEVAARPCVALVDVGLGRHVAGDLEDRVLGDQLERGVEPLMAKAAEQLQNDLGVRCRAHLGR